MEEEILDVLGKDIKQDMLSCKKPGICLYLEDEGENKWRKSLFAQYVQNWDEEAKFFNISEWAYWFWYNFAAFMKQCRTWTLSLWLTCTLMWTRHKVGTTNLLMSVNHVMCETTDNENIILYSPRSTTATMFLQFKRTP